MLNNARTLALCAARSLLPRSVTTLSHPDHFILALRSTTKQITCRYSSSFQEEYVNAAETDDFEGESPYANIDFDAVVGDDSRKVRQLKRIQLEIDMMRQQGGKVPIEITTEQWIKILRLDTLHDRTEFYRFLWRNELKTISKKTKQSIRHEKFLAKKASRPSNRPTVTTDTSPVYSLHQNTLFWRFSNCHMNKFYNLKLLYASMFSPHIIVDCGYEPFMTAKNLQVCVKQILWMWSENRSHLNPFHLVFCNLSNESEIFVMLTKTLLPSKKDEPEYPFYFTPEHYLNLYPREKLVYLTPHCSEELDEYHNDDIYIIGGFVDKNKCEPLSLAKAKKEKLRMARFPLERYLKWQVGTKSLTLNHSLAIMTDLKDTNDWNIALQNVPARKTRSRSEEDVGEDLEHRSNYASAKDIREHYRRNLVYDLLMKDSDKKCDEPSEKK